MTDFIGKTVNRTKFETVTVVAKTPTLFTGRKIDNETKIFHFLNQFVISIGKLHGKVSSTMIIAGTSPQQSDQTSLAHPLEFQSGKREKESVNKNF